MSDALRPIVEVIVIPGGTTLLALLLLARPWRRVDGRQVWALAPAMTLGVIAGAVVMLRSTVWWPAPNLRVAHVALVAMLGAGIVASLGRAPRARGVASVLMPALIASGMGAMMLAPLMRNAWSPLQSVVAVLGLGVAAGVWGFGIDAGVARRASGAPLMAMAIASAGSAGVLVLSGNAFYAQSCVVLGVVLVVGSVGTFLRPSMASPGLGVLPGVVLVCLWASGLAYAQAPVPPLAAFLIGAAPLSVGLGLVPAVSSGPAWRSAVAQALVAAALVGLGTLAMGLDYGG